MVDKKMLTEIFQGAVSLAILAFVILTYFSVFQWPSSSINDQYDQNDQSENRSQYPIYYYPTQNNNSEYKFPTERTIILRMDDVQGYTWNDIFINLTDAVLSKNMSITLGVIPYRNMENDIVAKKYLLDKMEDPRIEIALHGTSHSRVEFLNLGEEEAYNLAKLGLDKMMNMFNIRPITFIPPENEYDENTITALSKLGFKIISAKEKEYKYDRGMMRIGYTVPTKHSNEQDLVPVNKIFEYCKISLDEKNICVILIHPQDYVAEDKRSLNQTRYDQFVYMLDELKSLNTRYSTFAELI